VNVGFLLNVSFDMITIQTQQANISYIGIHASVIFHIT
jgi:hypothetical protein